MSEAKQSLKKKKVPGYFYSKFYKSISSTFGVITPPLRAYKPTFYKNTHKDYGVITLPFAGG